MTATILPAGIRLDDIWPEKAQEPDYAPEIVALREEFQRSVPVLAPQLKTLAQMREIRHMIGTLAGPKAAKLVLQRSHS